MKALRTSLGLFLGLFLLTGLIYPLAVLGLGQTLFPFEANGSLLKDKGVTIGSALIAQSFTSDIYFHPRPSAAGNGYDANSSSGSNLAPTSADLIKALKDRAGTLKAENAREPIPVDLVTSSASGLDPDISDAAARFQVPRIAAVRKIEVKRVLDLIEETEQKPQFGVLGETRVNVLKLNLALDQLAPAKN